ncbi:hypothetical protein LIA77_05385 [Sarocladium implicatum]|nr:hypothetical protein LIA77_05385 [Sarocladium implicatum]
MLTVAETLVGHSELCVSAALRRTLPCSITIRSISSMKDRQASPAVTTDETSFIPSTSRIAGCASNLYPCRPSAPVATTHPLPRIHFLLSSPVFPIFSHRALHLSPLSILKPPLLSLLVRMPIPS